MSPPPGPAVPAPPPAPATGRAVRLGVPLAVVCLAAAGVGGGVAAGRLPAAPELPGLPVTGALALYLVVAAALYLRVDHRGQANHVDLFEVVLAPALVLLPGALLVAVVALAKAGAEALRRRSPLKAAFNVAQWTAAAAAGSLVLTALRSPGEPDAAVLGPVLVALVAVVAVNALAVRGVLGLVAGGARRWPRSSLGLGAWALHRAVTVAVGLLFVLAWQWTPAATPAFVLGLVALHLAARATSTQRVGQARVVGLQRAHQALVRHADPRDAVDVFLDELRAAFDCALAELHLLEDGGVTSHRSGRVGGFVQQGTAPDRDPTGSADVPPPADDLDLMLRQGEPVRWVPTAPDPAVRALLERAGAHDALVAPIRTGGSTDGVLVTVDRAGPRAFEAGEVAVLEAAAAVLGEALHRSRLVREVAREQQALAASEARWRALVHDVSDLVVVADADLVVRFASPASRSMLGVPEADLLGRAFLTTVHPDDAGRVDALLHGLLRSGDGSRRVRFRLAAPAEHTHVEAVAHDLRADSAVGGVVLNLRDTTERHRAEALTAGSARVLELTAQGEPLETLLAAVCDLVEAQVDDAWCGVLPDHPSRDPWLVAPSAGPGSRAAVLAVVGALTASSSRAVPPTTLVVEDTRTDERCHGSGAHALGAGVAALWLVPVGAAPGSPADAALVVARRRPGVPTRHELGRLRTAAGLAHTAIERTRTQARLTHQAAHDPLTDLPNRALFVDRLQHALHQSGRHEASPLVLFLDLDNFKDVNDSLGHRTGDELLHAVGMRLRGAVRPGDTVARFGGDEFTILCDDVRDEAHAIEIAERIGTALTRPFHVAQRDVFVAASIGLALAADPGADPNAVIENADAAMYRAKTRGDQSYEVFDEGMRTRASQRLATQSALHRAVAREEFHLVYQPTVSLRTGLVVGVEALVRWWHPDAGVLSPDDFIPLAEQSGLIVPIGAQVIDLACHQARAWSDAAVGAGPTVSVNLSARQLGDPHLVPTVKRALDASGADPAGIYLELTESALVDDLEASGTTLHRLRDLGVRLLVDDFGTGYSSLSYLRRLPVDGLKVDRSFVAGLGGDAEAEAIVRAVIDLAHGLGLVAVAEGIETAAQAECLRRLDCEIGQGYHFGRPVPSTSLDDVLGAPVAVAAPRG